MKKTIYDLQLHETLWVDEIEANVTKVASGWIYKYTKEVYDGNTGEVKDDSKFMNMLEDFWMPRRDGGRGTEISTLGGGQNLGEIEDVEYFKKKMFLALNVPQSRMQPESGFQLGRATEINRDELKFTKFVGRLRKEVPDEEEEAPDDNDNDGGF